VPPPGKKFVVADLAQVQARILLWLAGDTTMLDLIRSGVDLYEAHARSTMGYSDPRTIKDVDPDKRQFAKMRVLQLGFACGAAKFQSSAATMYKVKMDLARAKREVDDYRRKSPGITRLWKQLDDAARASRGGTFTCELPSGRAINYFNVANAGGELTAQVERGGFRKKIYGGLLTQNLVAGINRDILADAVLRIEAAGIPVVLHVHDEVICEVDDYMVDEAARMVHDVMTTPPAWADGLPVGSDVKTYDHYQK
jgi:DNA polymerase